MSGFYNLLSTVFERRYRKGAVDRDSRTIEELAEALVGARGEASGQVLAQVILARYAELEDTGKLAFFRHVATGLDIDPDALRQTLGAYETEPGKASYRAFMAAAEPPRQELIRRLNQVTGATGELVKMRADLLRLSRDEPELQALDLDFRHLFASWFNRGFLVLQPVNWESPAYILEKIIAYEAVHAIHSWEDLRRRLKPHDRRCFAFFHPAMPDEPLIFVEVALTKDGANSIQSLLAEDRKILPEEKADTAVFYSISNCQAGLASISFGNFLIKQVAADLAAELPDLRTFITLSPIPGLTRWMATEEVGPPETAEAWAGVAAHYLTRAKRADGLPLDPVARFHLGNGAQVHAVHMGADMSPRGIEQSGGVMVNYLYDLDKVPQNHERFTSKHEIATSSEVRSLASNASIAA